MNKRTTLLVGFDPRTGLAVARSLSRQKIRVVVVTLAVWETPLPSRAVAGFRTLAGAKTADECREGLLTIVAEEDVDTLLPLTDQALSWVAPHLDHLRHVHVACPSPSQLSLILDKPRTLRLAAQCGVPVPSSIVYNGCGESLPGSSFPIFAKLRDKTQQTSLENPRQPAIGLARNQAELDVLYQEYGRENQLLEKYAEGEDVGLALLMENGTCLTAFQYRALKLQPATGGVCVLAQTEVVDPQLLAAGCALLKQLSWTGIAQLDFRQNRADGSFVFFEINGRFWGSCAVPIAAGLDFPHLLYQLLHRTGSTFPNHYKVGLQARWLEGDLRRLYQIYREQDPAYKSSLWWREFFEFCRSFWPGVRGMYWSWRDPEPCLYSLVLTLQYWICSRVRDRRRKPFVNTASLVPPSAVALRQPVPSTKK